MRRTQAEDSAITCGRTHRASGIGTQCEIDEAGRNGSNKRVWVLQADGQPQAVSVKTGASDGRMTEITGGDLREGMAVITDYQEAKNMEDVPGVLPNSRTLDTTFTAS